MDRQQKLKIALPVLLVIMAFVWGPILFGSGRKDRPSGKDVQVAPVPSENGNPVRRKYYKRTETSTADWGQNPFMLKRTPKALYIEGILWDANNPTAIISGQIVGNGDTVEGNTVVEIKPESVILRDADGNETELR